MLNTDAAPEDLREAKAFLSCVRRVDVTLQHGEGHRGIFLDDKLTITCSPGVSLPEEQITLKIGYEPTKGDPEDYSCENHLRQ